MLQKLFTAVALLSALFCAAFAVLWVRSFWSADVTIVSGREMHRLSSGGGGVLVESLGLFERKGDWRTGIGNRPRGVQLSVYTETPRDYAEWRRATFGTAPRWERKVDRYQSRVRLLSRQGSPGVNAFLPRIVPVTYRISGSYNNGTGQAEERWLIGRGVWMPYWILFAATALLPALRFPGALTWFRRARRQRRGLCLKCGFDLRASPDRCPECGSVAAAKSTANV